MALVTGGTVTTLGGYRIHRITESGNIVVSGGNVTIAIGDALAVGGGGGAGSRVPGGGGGGAGGSVDTNADVITLTPGTYAVTIGDGGAGGPAAAAEVGANGGNTTIFSITAVGGGGGGSGTTVGGVGGDGAISFYSIGEHLNLAALDSAISAYVTAVQGALE